jgi:serine/threonine-protein kinase
MTAAENTFTPTGTEARTGERAIGKYRPIALLGEGGMARVYLAVMKGPGGFTKLLVIKSLRESLEDPLYLRSFMFEARLAAQLNHPNVVQTFEVGEEAGRYFIAMEYLEGQSLRTVQRRLAPERLPLPMQLRILAEVARGLHHAHTLVSFDGTPLEIVHRDVSPQNVLITYEGQVKLLDFGIAKAQGGGDLTKTGMIKGKIDYIAPEQILGESVDQRADIFSLGVMLWEAITGKRFSGGAEVADVTKIHNRVSGREPKLRDVAPDTPIRLAEICERAVAPRAEDRYDTAEDFALALTDYLRGTSHMPSARDLADVVGPLFASERKKIRKVIDEQVRLIGAGKPEQELGVVDRLPRVSGGERSSTSVGHSGATLGSGI